MKRDQALELQAETTIHALSPGAHRDGETDIEMGADLFALSCRSWCYCPCHSVHLPIG
ncbi:Hypothetical protein P9303_01321 [Prochlorococcus marinus str. MIT 9303]|uniref:Uncharacterized protein n=1 Tax=Prochlorococcus marinus (strain MIT 9303) TaxID=59922 RepID=A2C5X7_PROM3|nr:Hypothetical protein P9303_01321 [Prochlorococcus marinus str. MIT 9303]